MGFAQQPRTGGGVCFATGKDRLTKGRAKSLAKRSIGRAYRCPDCRSWHIGTLRGERSR